MAAGLAAMRALDAPARARLDELGDRLRRGFDRAFERAGIRGRAIGEGSLANIHFTDRPVCNARDSLAAMLEAGSLGRSLHLAMLQRGITSASRLMYCTSTAMGEAEIDTAVAALEDALVELHPSIERDHPTLLCDGRL